MNYQGEFFTPEEVDRQIERVSRLQEGDGADAEAIAYLRSFYHVDARQEQEALDRIWNRIAPAIPVGQDHQEYEKELYMQNTQNQQIQYGSMGPLPPTRRRRTSLVQRLGLVAAVLFLIVLVGSMALVFNAVRNSNGGPPHPKPTPPPVVTHVPNKPAAFKVTSVTMAVNPTSIAGLACGTQVTVVYTAIFHVAPGSDGGTVRFGYTVNNGRGTTPASLTFAPGETTKTYTFTWKGALPADGTYPEPGGVEVTSPNQLISPRVGPTGKCTQAAAFQVTSVDMAVSPASIQGLACGTSIVVTYTATIHVAPNSPGGTVEFTYSVNNGRGQTPASVTFAPGQTTKTYTFTWSGTLTPDHTYPQQGGIMVTSPNQLIAQGVKPAGACS